MTAITPPPVTLSQIGRAAHDLGLAGLFGGNLFGRFALHPAVAGLSDPRERGKVVNAAWRRYGAVNTAGLLALTAGWAGARAGEAADGRLSDQERALARTKDALVAVVAVTGVATAVEGVRFARQAPWGAVPLEDGSHPAPQTPEVAARLKRRLDVLGGTALAAEAALVAVNAALAQAGFRRPPLRRRLWGR
jgi:hypothetical protein